MKRVDLKVTERSSTGSAEARRMRTQGIVPGIVYGSGNDSIVVEVEEKALRQAVGRERGNIILDLDIGGDGKKRPAMIKEVQNDPLTGKLLHIDFIEVRMDKPIDSHVHIELVGTPIGLRDGGILDHALRELHIRSLPNSIPGQVECQVEAMGIGDSRRVSDCVIPEGVEVLDDQDALVAAIMAPKLVVEEVTEVEEGAEAAPPAEGAAPGGEAAPEESQE